MQMWETGLIDLWEKRAIPKPTACLNIKQGRMGKKPKLSMRHLSGPFVILLIGYGISAFSFLTELVYGRLFPTTEKQLFG
jgi:hypothetical protein